MFKGNMAHIGELGEYTAFDNKAVKATRTFGIFPSNVSGTLEGKHVASFTIKVSSKAYKFPAADKKLVEWCAANGHNAADYKVMTIAIKF